MNRESRRPVLRALRVLVPLALAVALLWAVHAWRLAAGVDDIARHAGQRLALLSASLDAELLRFESLPAVVAGSTLGMMLVNGPAVLLGETAARRLPLKWIRIAAAAGFAATGLWILFAG